TAAFTLVSSVTSIPTRSTPRIGLAAFVLRTEPNTRAPRSASNCAISRPMPEETPVTNVVLFFSGVCIYTSLFIVYCLQVHPGLGLFVQSQRRSFEIGEDCGPTLFTKSFDCGVLRGLPSRGEFLNLFSAFGCNRQFHTIAVSATDGLY